jgi:hypothetical protein
MLHHVDEKIVIAAQAGDWKKVEELQPQVFEAFWDTPEGSNLRDTGISTKVLSSRLIDEFKRRFDGESIYPGVPMVHRFQQIADDLLRAEAVKVAPEPKVVTEADAHVEKVKTFKKMMADPKVSTFEIRQLRQKSPEWARAWQAVNELEVVVEDADPASADLKKFAYLVNRAVMERGTAAIRPQAGRVYITPDGIPAKEFELKLELAISKQLIA